MKLFLCLWLILECGLAVKIGSRKRRLAESSDEEPQDGPTSRNSAGSSSRIERLSSEDESIPEPPAREDDPFTRDLKHRWAKGKLTSADVHSLASNAKHQGARNLEKLAAAGTDGTHSIL